MEYHSSNAVHRQLMNGYTNEYIQSYVCWFEGACLCLKVFFKSLALAFVLGRVCVVVVVVFVVAYSRIGIIGISQTIVRS